MSDKKGFGVFLLLAGALIIIGLILQWALAEFGILGFLIATAGICLFAGHILIDD